MASLEANLSVPLKAVMSYPISGGRGESWASVLSVFLVGEGGGSGDRSGMIGSCGIGSRGWFGLWC